MSSADKKIEQHRKAVEQFQIDNDRNIAGEHAITKILTMLADEGFNIKETEDVLIYARMRVNQMVGKTKFADAVEHFYASHDAS